MAKDPFFYKVFAEFRKKYARATKRLQRIYNFPEYYPVGLMVKKEWKRWESYKSTVKFVEKCLKLPGSSWDDRVFKAKVDEFRNHRPLLLSKKVLKDSKKVLS